MAKYTYLPQDLSTLNPGDEIYYGDKLTYQDPKIQQMIIDNNIGDFIWGKDRSSGAIGLTVKNTPILPTTQVVPTTTTASDTTKLSYEDLLQAAMNAYNQPEADYNKQLGDITGTDAYKMQQDALQQQYNATVGDITNQYNSMVGETRDVGNRNAGSLARILGRAGGFTTTAGGQAMLAQEQGLQNQINSLNQARSAAISQAHAAQIKGDADLMSKALDTLATVNKDLQTANKNRADALLAIANQMETSEQNLLDNQYKYDALSQNQQQFEQEQANSSLKDFLDQGWTYVSTPLERDNLKKIGFEVIQRDGKTYTRKPEWMPDEYVAYKKGGGPLGYNEWVNWNEQKKKSGSGKSDMDNFETDIKNAQNQLLKGASWGQVWETLYNVYKTGDSAQDAALGTLLDKMLDKDTWSKPGAYQTIIKSNNQLGTLF